MKYPKPGRLSFFFFLSFLLFLLPTLASSTCECEADLEERDKTTSLKLKFIAIASILTAGAVGVVIPILGKWVPALSPEKNAFFLIKSFAAGVILATALIHILPDAFENLTSPCLKEDPWRKFPFAGFVSMMSALVTLMIDTVATSYFKRKHFSKSRPVDDDGDEEEAQAGHVHVHTHAGHGHSHGALPAPEDEARMAESLRHRIVSQVLELGIVVHSVIIGISLGASQSSPTINPLIGALSFHQFFEGMGLGSCIVQAKFKARAMAIMALFFSLTTPVGIGFGIAVSSSYNADSTTSLIVEGIFNAASAGILIYMSLVDLLAADFMSDKVQNSGRLQFWAYLALLLGAGFMSVIAKWN